MGYSGTFVGGRGDMPVRVELIGDREEALRRGRDESSG
jgi:hypothetical protein